MKAFTLSCVMALLTCSAIAQDRDYKEEIKKIFADKNDIDITVNDGLFGGQIEESYFISGDTLYEKGFMSITSGAYLKDIDFSETTANEDPFNTLNNTDAPVFSLTIKFLDGKTKYYIHNYSAPEPAEHPLTLYFSNKEIAEQALEYIKQLASGAETKYNGDDFSKIDYYSQLNNYNFGYSPASSTTTTASSKLAICSTFQTIVEASETPRFSVIIGEMLNKEEKRFASKVQLEGATNVYIYDAGDGTFNEGSSNWNATFGSFSTEEEASTKLSLLKSEFVSCGFSLIEEKNLFSGLPVCDMLQKKNNNIWVYKTRLGIQKNKSSSKYEVFLYIPEMAATEYIPLTNEAETSSQFAIDLLNVIREAKTNFRSSTGKEMKKSGFELFTKYETPLTIENGNYHCLVNEIYYKKFQSYYQGGVSEMESLDLLKEFEPVVSRVLGKDYCRAISEKDGTILFRRTDNNSTKNPLVGLSKKKWGEGQYVLILSVYGSGEE